MRLWLFFFLCLPFLWAKPPRGTYLGDGYYGIQFIKPKPPVVEPSRVVILPVLSYAGAEATTKTTDLSELNPPDGRYPREAFEQLAVYFRGYGYQVPSFLEIRQRLIAKGIRPYEYEKNLELVGTEYRADFVLLMDIKRLRYAKQFNLAGVFVAGALITGVGRYVTAEYLMTVYIPATRVSKTYTAYERRKDYGLGFWQSPKKFASRLQSETVQALLKEFSTQAILRSKGYILEPLDRTFEDSKGFQ